MEKITIKKAEGLVIEEGAIINNAPASSSIPEKIEYYKAKIEKRKCDLERDNACLNSQLLGLITIHGSITFILISLLSKENLFYIFLSTYFSRVSVIICYSLILIGYLVVSSLEYHYYKERILKKVSSRADRLNEFFKEDIIKIGKLSGINGEELERYRLFND